MIFFDDCQTATLIDSGVTSDTISSNGYQFFYTRDKLFTGGTGQPIGRQVRVPWPDGVEAQAVTTPPPGVTDYHARITLQRVDGQVFDLHSFTAKLLANTGGAGGAIEIMPLVDGEDAFADPIFFDVSGYYGQTFSYDTSPNPWGSTALLTGFDTYKVALYVDFAFIALQLDSALQNPQACCLPDDSCAELTTSECTGQGGTSQGSGIYCGCSPCAVPSYTITTAASPPDGGTTTGDGAYDAGTPVSVVAAPNVGFHFVDWTEGGITVSTLSTYDFTASASRSLVANFTLAGIACATQTECVLSGGDVCMFDQCATGFCQSAPVRFGNVNGSANQSPNLDDILCVLAGFADIDNCPNGDLAPTTGPSACQGNGIINLDDILSILAAFGGANPCGCTG